MMIKTNAETIPIIAGIGTASLSAGCLMVSDVSCSAAALFSMGLGYVGFSGTRAAMDDMDH